MTFKLREMEYLLVSYIHWIMKMKNRWPNISSGHVNKYFKDVKIQFLY